MDLTTFNKSFKKKTTFTVWETIIFQTLAKMASGLKLLLAKMKKSSPCLASDIFFKLANKYQINNTVMFNNLFCRF